MKREYVDNNFAYIYRQANGKLKKNLPAINAFRYLIQFNFFLVCLVYNSRIAITWFFPSKIVYVGVTVY